MPNDSQDWSGSQYSPGLLNRASGNFAGQQHFKKKTRDEDIYLDPNKKSMPNEPAKKPAKASRGLSSFFQPAINTVAGMDPTGVLLQLLAGGPTQPSALAPTAQPDDYNFVPSTPQLGDPLVEGMNRQNKIKSTFGKIPGR